MTANTENLMINETYINATAGHGIGSSDWIESSYTASEVGKLYKSLVSEYGRCTGKVHVDRRNGETLTIGWVFVKRMSYSDCRETYLQETWVERRLEVDYLKL